MSSQPRYQVSTLTRALDILEALTRREPELTLTEIADRVGLPLSTTTRLTAVLEERGYLERVPGTDAYRIGVRAFEVGNLYIQATSLEAEAQPILRTLARICNQTANLAVLDRQHVVHIAVVPPDRPMRYWATVGQREEAYITGLGKILLAGLSDDEVRARFKDYPFVAHTPKTITSVDALLEQVAKARENGYAIDDEESNVGLRCIAAPVRNHQGEVVAAISISGPAFEVSLEPDAECLQAVRKAGHDISARLGYSCQSESGESSTESSAISRA